MKVAVIVLNYLRYDLAAQTMIRNLPSADYPFGLIVVEEFGLAKAMNIGLKRAIKAGYEAFMFMGNDIIEPHNWLRSRAWFMEANPKCGICSISLEGRDQPEKTHIIGNYLIRKEVIDKIGGFDESYDPYGAIDLDFCHRANKAGFETWYIAGRVEHIGNHGAEDEMKIYGYSKYEMIQKTWNKFVESTYHENYTIFENQFEGE